MRSRLPPRPETRKVIKTLLGTGPSRRFRLAVAGVVGGAVLLAFSSFAAAASPAVSDRFALVNHVRLHNPIGGKGSPVVLLHG